MHTYLTNKAKIKRRIIIIGTSEHIYILGKKDKKRAPLHFLLNFVNIFYLQIRTGFEEMCDLLIRSLERSHWAWVKNKNKNQHRYKQLTKIKRVVFLGKFSLQCSGGGCSRAPLSDDEKQVKIISCTLMCSDRSTNLCS